MPSRGFAQDAVADGVTVGVVDLLEVVDVQEQAGERARVALRQRDRLRGASVEPAAVEHARQPVARRRLGKTVADRFRA